MMHLPKHVTTLQKGFTLIELTIVFTIMAVIGGLGFAAYSSFNSRQTLDSAAYDLKAGIDEAKLMAVSRVKPAGCTASHALEGYRVRVCFATGSGCSNISNLYEISPICVPQPNPSPVPQSKIRTSNIGLAVVNCPNYPLIFSSQIGYQSGACEFLLLNTQDSKTKTVCIDSGGNVTVKDTAGC